MDVLGLAHECLLLEGELLSLLGELAGGAAGRRQAVVESSAFDVVAHTSATTLANLYYESIVKICIHRINVE